MTGAQEDGGGLARRLLEAIPATSYEMGALLGLLRVEETREVPTAAITCEKRPVLKVNPDFVAAHCRTDEHLFLLVMHEVHHVLLGHTRLFPRPTRLHNLAFDAVINALLCARFPERAYRSFFLGYYGAETGPLRLLAPPEGEPIADGALRKIHELLYPPKGTCDTTFREVFDRLVTHLAEGNGGGFRMEGLLGSHGENEGDAEGEWGTEGPLDAEVVAAIRKIVEKWPQPPEPRRGRSLDDLLKEVSTPPATPAERVLAATRRALLASAGPAGRSPVRRAAPVPATLPYPVANDRRATVARLAGVEPLLFAGSLVSPRARSTGRTRVYLDVSGSMDPWLPCLYGTLVRLAEHVEPRLHCFSTTVVSIPLSEIAAGRRSTTGGTHGAVALEHALKERATRILLVTDGYVGPVAAPLADRLRAARTDVRVLLTPGGWRKDLESVASLFQELPEMNEERRTA